MAAGAPLVFPCRRTVLAGREDGFTLERPFSVMTSPAMIAFLVCARFNIGAPGLHGETNIHMAQSAGKTCTVQPMVEDNAIHASPCRISVEDYPAVLSR